MRVLALGNMYPPHHLGGYELMWRSAMGALRARGCEVRVLTTDFARPDPDPTLPDDPGVYRELRWYWRDHRFPRLSLRDRLGLERHNQRVLADHLADWRPDVVNWWAMGGMSLSLVEAVRRVPLPAVGIVVDGWMIYAPRVDAYQRICRGAGPLRALLERRTGAPASVDLDGAGRWLFVSEAARKAARDAGLRLPDSSIAHAGVDAGRFSPAAPREWSWDLLYVGRIDPRKGLPVAVGALEELPAARLTVIGDGDEAHRAQLRALAAELGVAERLSFEQRRREELPAAYAASDAVLFPVQWDEPWGLVPLEAMAVGRPVVATGTGGSGEYLRDGENCLLFQPVDSAAALAEAVRRLAADPALRSSLAAGGSRTAARLTEQAFNATVAEAILSAGR